MQKVGFGWALLAGTLALAGCDGVGNRLAGAPDPGDDPGSNPAPPPPAPEPPPPAPAPPPAADFRMQLLHFADVDGAGGADDVRNFSALVDGFRSEMPGNTLLLSSGDNFIPGPEFFAASDDRFDAVVGSAASGRAHIGWLNAMGVQATVVGNHDLDQGPVGLAELIAADGDWPGAQFPYLSANIDFSTVFPEDPEDGDVNLNQFIVEDGQPAQPNSVASSATLTVGGETIGVVGGSFPELGGITDIGDGDTGFLEITPTDASDIEGLAAAIQPAVDALIADGIDKIILLAHMQQINIERQLAAQLEGVDIIVAGGSNSILADFNDRLREGDAAADTYPVQLQSASGEPVLLVNTAGDFRYLGRLVVSFDDDGVVLPDSIDAVESGAFATDMLPDASFEPIAEVAAITDVLDTVLTEKDGNVLGFTNVFLEGRREFVRTEETNFGNLTAEANLWQARQADPDTLISIKNGGGIRAPIGQAQQPDPDNPGEFVNLPPAANPDIGKPEGGISQLDVETTLRFNNGLTLLTVTAAELADIVEHTVANVENVGGQFPQVAGIRFSFDPTEQSRTEALGGNEIINQADPTIVGDRLRTLAVVDDSGAVIDQVVEDGMVVGDPDRSFRIVTLSFLALCVPTGDFCGDSYPFGGLTAPNRADIGAEAGEVGTDPGRADFSPFGGEQDALAEYLQNFFPSEDEAFAAADTPASEDVRIQNLSVAGRDDTVMTLPRLGVLNQIGRFTAPGAGFDEGAAEIVAHDPGTQRLFVINAEAGTIDVLDFSDPTNPTRIDQLNPVADDTTPGVTLDGVNSVAVSSTGLVAAALEADPATDNGRVGFYDAATLEFLGSVVAGPLPDMVAFTPDGSRLLVANEGETPEDDADDELRVFADDVPGSVSVIDLRNGVGAATSTAVGFEAFNAGAARAGELPAAVRINPNALSVAHDLEPEYITVSEDGSRALVSLQENSAIAVIDIAGLVVERIIAMGSKDHGLADNAFDASDDDGECTDANPECINIQRWPNVRGLHMPDTIDTFRIGERLFVVTANEGDGRGGSTDECALKDQGDAGEPALPLDPVAFPSPSLTDDEKLGELTISCDKIGGDASFAGDLDGDGDLDELRAFGARSMSIIEVDGAADGIISDTGDDFERITAHLDLFGDAPFVFNDDNDDDSPDRDGRSDAKGPEPEALAVGTVGDRILAFVGFERVGGIAVYDVSNPRLPRFLDYVNNRDFTVLGEDLDSGALPPDAAGDWGPEGMVFIPAQRSPNGSDLLVVGNEVSGTTTVYEVRLAD